MRLGARAHAGGEQLQQARLVELEPAVRGTLDGPRGVEYRKAVKRYSTPAFSGFLLHLSHDPGP